MKSMIFVSFILLQPSLSHAFWPFTESEQTKQKKTAICKQTRIVDHCETLLKDVDAISLYNGLERAISAASESLNRPALNTHYIAVGMVFGSTLDYKTSYRTTSIKEVPYQTYLKSLNGKQQICDAINRREVNCEVARADYIAAYGSESQNEVLLATAKEMLNDRDTFNLLLRDLIIHKAKYINRLEILIDKRESDFVEPGLLVTIVADTPQGTLDGHYKYQPTPVPSTSEDGVVMGGNYRMKLSRDENR